MIFSTAEGKEFFCNELEFLKLVKITQIIVMSGIIPEDFPARFDYCGNLILPNTLSLPPNECIFVGKDKIFSDYYIFTFDNSLYIASLHNNIKLRKAK